MSERLNAEQQIEALLAPATPEQAEQRRRQRDHDDAATLRRIVDAHHDGNVEGLTLNDLRVLTAVAHRLHKGWVESANPKHYVIVAGDDHSVVHGPFPSDEQAVEWAAKTFVNDSWHYAAGPS